jgi:N-acetyl-anhydromuramyl-L-alanine amidase AmpD
MADPITFHFTLPANNRPSFIALDEQVHPAFAWLTTNRATSRGADIINIIDTVVVHATAGFATQHAVDTWRVRSASAHWIIPDEDEPQHGQFVWATVAEAKAAIHVRNSIDVNATVLGSGPKVNKRSLGIEIVNTQDVQNYTDAYSAWQVKMAAQIVLYAWAKYPRLKHVISHAKLDPTRRGDPGRQFPWADFKQAVLSHSALPTPNPLVFEVAAASSESIPEGAKGACTP